MKQSIPLIQENSPQNINFFFKNNCRIKTICLIQKEENNRKSHKFSLFYLFQIKTLNKIDILRGGGCCPSCSNCPESINNTSKKCGQSDMEMVTSRQGQYFLSIENFLNELQKSTEEQKSNQFQQNFPLIHWFQKNYLIIDQLTQKYPQDTNKLFQLMNKCVNNILLLLKSKIKEINDYNKLYFLTMCNQFIKLQSRSFNYPSDDWKKQIDDIEQSIQANQTQFLKISLEFEITCLKSALNQVKTIQPSLSSDLSDLQSYPQSYSESYQQNFTMLNLKLSKDFSIFQIQCSFQTILWSFLNQISQEDSDIEKLLDNLSKWFEQNIKDQYNSQIQYFWMKLIVELITFSAIDIYEMKKEEVQESLIQVNQKNCDTFENNENLQIIGIRQLQMYLQQPINDLRFKKTQLNLNILINHIQKIDQQMKQNTSYLFDKLFKRLLYLQSQISQNSNIIIIHNNSQTLLFEIIYIINEIDLSIAITLAKVKKTKLILSNQLEDREKKLILINQLENTFQELYTEFTLNYEKITQNWFQQLIQSYQNKQKQKFIDQKFLHEINKSIQIAEKFLNLFNQDFQDILQQFDSSINGIEFQWFFVKFIQIIILEFEKGTEKDKKNQQLSGYENNNYIINVFVDSFNIVIGIFKLFSNKLNSLFSNIINKFNEITNKLQDFKKSFKEKIQDTITIKEEKNAIEFYQDLYNQIVKSYLLLQNQTQEISKEIDKIINLLNDLSIQDDSTIIERNKEIQQSQKIIIDIINNQQKSFSNSANNIDQIKQMIDQLIENLNQIKTTFLSFNVDYQNLFKNLDIQQLLDNLKVNLKLFINDFNLCFINLINYSFSIPEVKSTFQLIQQSDIQNLNQSFKEQFQIIIKLKKIFDNQDSFLDHHLGYFLINASNIVQEDDFRENIEKILQKTKISDKKKNKLTKETYNLEYKNSIKKSLKQKEYEENIENFFQRIFSSSDQ